MNAAAVRATVDAAMPLLWFLRDDLGLSGTRYGCGRGLCGACTVLLDDVPARACQVPVGTLDGRDVVTIEGVSGRVARAVRSAWQAHGVSQCGYCQSGQMMAAIGLLTGNPSPSDADIDAAMSGNLCRCNTYCRIRAAIRDAARASVPPGGAP